jgi:predicted metalloprotease with PDZ domain
VRRSAGGYVVQVPESGAVRFRYRLDLLHRAPEGSTGSGLDTTRLYAVTRSLFVAPDPTTFRKTGAPYPALVVEVLPPAGWQVVAGWPGGDGLYQPADGEELLGATLAAAPDFRARTGTAGGVSWHLAVRSDRYFADSLLAAVVEASLARAVAALGRVDVPRVTYIADEGRKGRTSGSLQGRSSIGLIWEPSEVLEAARAHDVFHETLHLWFGGAMEAERWWTEGVTDYVAARLLAEWRTEPELLAQLCYESLQHYRRIAHRFRLTMAQETREGIGGDNTELLVYRKGMLAGLLLDAAVRRGSGGRRTLDDASRALLALAAGRRNRNVTEAELRAAVEREGGAAAARTWQRVVAGTDALTEADLADALREVTGRHLPAPPELAKDRKQLRP